MSAVRVRVNLGAEPATGLMAMVGYSIAGHMVAFIGFILAPHMIPTVPPPPLILSGEIVTMPSVAARPTAPPPAAAKPASPAKPAEKPAPKPEPPRRKPEIIPPEPGKPKPEKKEPPERTKAQPGTETGKAPQPAGPIPEGVGLITGAEGSISGIPSITSEVFPYEWYRATIVNLIRSRWRRPVTPGLTQALRCSVSFVIAQNGTVSDVAVATSSGFSALDQSAHRAVVESSPLPSLPFQYVSASVRAELIFELTPD